MIKYKHIIIKINNMCKLADFNDPLTNTDIGSRYMQYLVRLHCIINLYDARNNGIGVDLIDAMSIKHYNNISGGGDATLNVCCAQTSIVRHYS